MMMAAKKVNKKRGSFSDNHKKYRILGKNDILAVAQCVCVVCTQEDLKEKALMSCLFLLPFFLCVDCRSSFNDLFCNFLLGKRCSFPQKTVTVINLVNRFSVCTDNESLFDARETKVWLHTLIGPIHLQLHDSFHDQQHKTVFNLLKRHKWVFKRPFPLTATFLTIRYCSQPLHAMYYYYLFDYLYIQCKRSIDEFMARKIPRLRSFLLFGFSSLGQLISKKKVCEEIPSMKMRRAKTKKCQTMPEIPSILSN